MDVCQQRRPNKLGRSIKQGHQDRVIQRNILGPGRIGLRDGQQPCVNKCYNQFVEEWYGKTHGGFESVCDQLAHVESDTELLRLYCCDSTNCGVATEVKGQSPSVDLIINKCQNIGNYLIYDPGPPQSNGFNCSTLASGESGNPTPLPSNSPSAMETTIPSSSSAAAATSLSSELNSTASGFGAVPSTPTGLTEGSKAAIGICSSLAIIAIIFLVGYLISRRRSPPKSFAGNAPPNAPRLNRSSSEPPSGSHTPLITPPLSAKGPPLTPPARLSDRRFLPPLLKQGQGGTPSSSLVDGIDERAYLPIALGSPTEKKSALRHGRQTTPNGVAKSAGSPSLPTAVHFAPQLLRDSGSSYSSGHGGASTASNKVDSVYSGTALVHGTHTPPLSSPLSPTRPARPHNANARLEIPDLVTPAGPPPSRALPVPPPPYHPVSPTFTVSPLTPSSPPTLPFRPLALGDSTRAYSSSHLGTGTTDHKGYPETGGGLSSSARDLCDLTESYARETSESWGSWNGGGGGGPGVGIAAGGGGGSRKRGSGGRARDIVNGNGEKKGERGSVVSLQELDLESLGGKY
ncbi:uncharacterized protein F4807DRAFT_119996 [Annulohypoxylon truncatum]|uniref:uncharacterized protein n=1 Tax=Annulohypoxylon truncatum TaxID=327061 RepID=UPI002007F12F|nr:uncharacterized protein F4807DRAFT_119996 [Annulohypoxylon truncatum]KAI1214279.1 hypothetical protein F4807DRAFT_119996 [Annulohypoxylon truncatum]